MQFNAFLQCWLCCLPVMIQNPSLAAWNYIWFDSQESLVHLHLRDIVTRWLVNLMLEWKESKDFRFDSFCMYLFKMQIVPGLVSKIFCIFRRWCSLLFLDLHLDYTPINLEPIRIINKSWSSFVQGMFYPFHSPIYLVKVTFICHSTLSSMFKCPFLSKCIIIRLLTPGKKKKVGLLDTFSSLWLVHSVEHMNGKK